ncbi:nucleotidyltransferase family protein [Pelolinea submarina]|nr:nucleotidyltransferase family protein [Pelolinea submarina]BBB48532.1 molybdenum cofactor cytidylyltransferase [Pelolinea submarina]
MSLKKEFKIAGLIMAAGGSSRLDSPKQLLKWGDQLLINHVLDVIMKAGIDPIYLVLGSHAEEIRKVLPSSGINILTNPDWREGMSTSIKCGLNALGEDVEGTFIFLSDQPFVFPELIRAITVKFTDTGAQISAPRVNGRQCNPVLFRRSFFPDLMTISGDRGAKNLISQHEVAWVDWPDERLLLDIDSAEDYRRAFSKDGE